MAQLTFNTDEGRTTSTLISTTSGNLSTELTNLRNNINSLVGSAWVGNSATLFQGEFDTWASDVQRIITELENLKSRLDNEIVEWENTAASFT